MFKLQTLLYLFIVGYLHSIIWFAPWENVVLVHYDQESHCPFRRWAIPKLPWSLDAENRWWERWSSGKTMALGSWGPWFKSRPDHRNFLSYKFIPHLLLFTQVYKWVSVREISQCAVAACTILWRKRLTDDLWPSDRGDKCQSRLNIYIVNRSRL